MDCDTLTDEQIWTAGRTQPVQYIGRREGASVFVCATASLCVTAIR